MTKRIYAPYWLLFFAIVGITAGIAAKIDGTSLKTAILALKGIAGGELLKLALPGILIDTMLYLFCQVVISHKLKVIMCVSCIWFKAYIMGCFIKGAFSALPLAAAVLLSLLVVSGGGAVCGAVAALAGEREKERQLSSSKHSVYLFAAGIMTEGIIMPSAAKLVSLLMN